MREKEYKRESQRCMKPTYYTYGENSTKGKSKYPICQYYNPVQKKCTMNVCFRRGMEDVRTD